MNKQSNTYTILYIMVMVLIVGSALALISMSLRDRQQMNADSDKMKQILAAVHVVPSPDNVVADFHKYIVAEPVVDASGAVIAESGAFEVNVAVESKVADDKRQLPVYVCRLDGDVTKYIIPVYGAGLWGPIWGYVAFDSDGSTVYGAYFAHQGETPGLGAEIEKPAFSNQFEGKTVFHGDRFLPIAVVKAGQKPLGGEDYVDGVSGGTITSKGVGAMLENCLSPYANYLKSLITK